MKNNDVSLAGTPFPIVGIGASAGGLVALEQLFSHMPPNSGMAFVVVQHFDPHWQGLLLELPRRHTIMPVVEAQDQMRIEPDHVYVIPPGSHLAVLPAVLHVPEPSEPRGLRLPISDVSAAKRLEAELRATQASLSELLETSKLEGVGDGLS